MSTTTGAAIPQQNLTASTGTSLRALHFIAATEEFAWRSRKPSATQPTSTVNTDEPSFLCEFNGCPRSEVGNGFVRERDLIRHRSFCPIRISKRHVCPWCAASFHTRNRLLSHARKTHPGKHLKGLLIPPSPASKRLHGGAVLDRGRNQGRDATASDAPRISPGPQWAPGHLGRPGGEVEHSLDLSEIYSTTLSDPEPLPPSLVFDPASYQQGAPCAASNSKGVGGAGVPLTRDPRPRLAWTRSQESPLQIVGQDGAIVTWQEPGVRPSSPEPGKEVVEETTTGGVAGAPGIKPGRGEGNGDNVDAKTIISAATTVVPAVAQNAVTEVCNNIYDRIRGHINEDNRDTVLEALPELIEAFAIRLVLLDSTDIDRRVMHFVYTRHRTIACELRRMFYAEVEDEKPSFLKPQDGMSLAEKMVMWQAQASCDSPSPSPVDFSEFFQGLEEDPEEGAHHAEVQTYSRAILQSKAYEWLIRHILKHSSLDWGNGGAPTICRCIRRAIMDDLPSGRIIKNEGPVVYHVEFQLPRGSLIPRFLLEREKRTSSPLWNVWPGAVVLVGSSDDSILAITVREYINQAWGLGEELLEALLEHFPEQGDTKRKNSCSPTELDGLHALYKPDSETLSFLAKGDAYSIAKRGEQLAWLLASLQCSDGRGVVYTKPSIRKTTRTGNKAWKHQTVVNSVWRIDVDVTPQAHDMGTPGALSALKKLGRLGASIETVVVQGFPTVRRPLKQTGLEISTNVFDSFSAIPLRYLKSTCRRVRLSGSSGTLELVELNHGVCIWHVVGAQGDRCDCRRGQPLQVPRRFLHYRHILDICRGPEDPESNHRSTPTRPAPPCSPSAGTTNTPQANSTSDAQCFRSGSPETSLDSEMMSIPSSSASPSPHIPDNMSQVIDAVARQLVHEFRNKTSSSPTGVSQRKLQDPQLPLATDAGTTAIRACTQGGTTETQRPIAPRPSSSFAASHEGSKTHPRSRKRVNDEDEDDTNDNQGNRPPSKWPRLAKDLPANKSLACPFWKFDPVRHRHCLKLEKFLTVNRLKQHLHRRHREPDIYCDRCKKIFENQDAHQRHLQDPPITCVFQPWDPRDRLINRFQQRELHKKSKGATESERWYGVWDILFADHPRPSSPYIDLDLSEDFRLFQEYARGRGRTILLERLRAEGFRHSDTALSGQALETYSLEAVSRALNSFLESFLAFRPSSDPPTDTRADSAPESLGRETPLSSFADSGVGSSSQRMFAAAPSDTSRASRRMSSPVPALFVSDAPKQRTKHVFENNKPFLELPEDLFFEAALPTFYGSNPTAAGGGFAPSSDDSWNFGFEPLQEPFWENLSLQPNGTSDEAFPNNDRNPGEGGAG
ncbi:hypothetical protein VTK26DRAFT_7959 [Humicola hyalothermophila]